MNGKFDIPSYRNVLNILSIDNLTLSPWGQRWGDFEGLNAIKERERERDTGPGRGWNTSNRFSREKCITVKKRSFLPWHVFIRPSCFVNRVKLKFVLPRFLRKYRTGSLVQPEHYIGRFTTCPGCWLSGLYVQPRYYVSYLCSHIGAIQ